MRHDAAAMVRQFDDLVDEVEDVVARIWARDDSVWPHGTGRPEAASHPSDRFAWLDAATAHDHQRWIDLAEGLVADGVRDVLLIGTGGSVAIARVMAALVPGPRLRLHVLDSLHPDAVEHVRRGVDPRSWAVVAVVAPGDLVTASLLARFRADLLDGVGGRAGLEPEQVASRLVVIDHDAGRNGDGPGGAHVHEDATLDGPFGALAAAGLAPAGLLGLLPDHVRGLASAVEAARSGDVRHNDAARLGVFLAAAVRADRHQLTVVADPAVPEFVDWVEHLVASATGKAGTGLVPIVDEPLLEPIAYGPTRVVVTIGAHHGVRGVADAGIPLATLEGFGLDGLAVEVFRWQFATAVACALVGVDPFALPQVTAARATTRAILDGGGGRVAVEPADELVDRLEDADWLGLIGFVDPDDVTGHALHRATATLRRRYGIPVRLGFAPACLATSGQLHKGGPPGGVFAVVVEQGSARPPVPGTDTDFATLLTASAAGDVRALRDAGRFVRVVDLDDLLDA